MPNDTLTDFTFIGQAITVPMLVEVTDAMPAKSLAEPGIRDQHIRLSHFVLAPKAP